ncbi:protein neprosin-like isoform X2 [Magnolia sinica]|uniref:protein neprosin-like isoform X2 n=1 Tax=Magnolia sinica TaxID=86752 RepID=UPI00265A5D67|nr:protein neprosin-like isoform X2 [Magnolia sinica]
MAIEITCGWMNILILVLVAISILHSNARIQSKDECLGLRRQFKLLNKPAVKSIQTEYGDIFDCVDMYKQPAFDHPLLKNHKIQMNPTSYPKGMENQEHSNANIEIGLKDGGCPLGTVPIRRTKMQDLLRAKSLSDFGRKNVSHLHTQVVGHHYALATSEGQVYGTGVSMNLWGPMIPDQRQFSLAQLWVLNGPQDQLNTIEAGWSADGYQKTGCYNILCPGFVLVSRDVAVGAIIQPTSTYNGAQMEVPLLVFKDASTGNWWLAYGNNNVQVGYWPKSIFTSLADSAAALAWGGEVYTPPGSRSPEMGSGHFPDEGLRKACYMRLLRFVDNENTLRDIPNKVTLFEDIPQCYKVIDGGNYLGGVWGRNIYFGGPGGC